MSRRRYALLVNEQPTPTPSARLSASGRATIKQLLAACLDELQPLGGATEFDTQFSLSPSEFATVAAAYPDVDEYDDDATGCDDSWSAINNAFGYALGCSDAAWERIQPHLSVSRAGLQQLHFAWRG